MKKQTFLNLALAAALALMPAVARASAEPGKPAPAFEVKDGAGKTHKLGDYSGRWLVLEWFNKDCPFVKKHYGSDNMQALQKELTGKKVAWLSVVSSAEGKQGYLTPAEATAVAKEEGSAAEAILLDTDGAMGKAYGAKATPHMFVINPKGEVVYAGAIDDNDSSDPSVIPTSTNYVRTAVAAGLDGKPVAVSATRAYGCSVKY